MPRSSILTRAHDVRLRPRRLLSPDPSAPPVVRRPALALALVAALAVTPVAAALPTAPDLVAGGNAVGASPVGADDSRLGEGGSPPVEDGAGSQTDTGQPDVSDGDSGIGEEDQSAVTPDEHSDRRPEGPATSPERDDEAEAEAEGPAVDDDAAVLAGTPAPQDSVPRPPTTETVTGVDLGSGPVAGGTTVEVPQIEPGRIVQHHTVARATVALDDDGQIFTWGWVGSTDAARNLGDGSTLSSTTPVAVDMSGAMDGAAIVQVRAGDTYFMALDSEGAVYTWGGNARGQLGIGSTAAQALPVVVDTGGALAGRTVTQIAASSAVALALTDDGQVVSWGGDTTFPVLGDGSAAGVVATRPVPVDTSGVLGGLSVTRVEAVWNTAYVIASDGRVYGWGAGTERQLGNGSTANAGRPVAVTWSGPLTGRVAVDVAAGGTSAMILTADGALFAWGSGTSGGLGTGGAANVASPVPVIMPALGSGKVVDIAKGAVNGAFVTDDGRTYVWGRGLEGSLGDGAVTVSRSTPGLLPMTGVLAGRTLTAVQGDGNDRVAGAGFVGLASDGELVGWGRNNFGSLGVGSTTVQQRPVRVAPLPLVGRVLFGEVEAASVAAGGARTLRAVSPAHPAGLVDVTVRRGVRQVVYEKSFRFGEGLAPEVVTHPQSVVGTEPGTQVTLTVVGRGNSAPDVRWEHAMLGGDAWMPVPGGDGGEPTTETDPDGEVARVTSTLHVTTTLLGARYRAVLTNELGEATSHTALVVPALLLPEARLTVTPRATLVGVLGGD